jgi:hypothetical protein
VMDMAVKRAPMIVVWMIPVSAYTGRSSFIGWLCWYFYRNVRKRRNSANSAIMGPALVERCHSPAMTDFTMMKILVICSLPVPAWQNSN